MRAWVAIVLLAASPLPAAAARLDAFARCLTSAGAVFYGAVWCGHCRAQQRMFGTAFRFVTYVECSESGSRADQAQCGRAGVSTFPTWTVGDRGRLTGRVSFERLASVTGCPLSGGGNGSESGAAPARGGVTDLSGRGVEVIEVPR